MKHTIEERLVIGRQICTHEITHKEAVERYGISISSVDKYVAEYKRKNGMSIKAQSSAPITQVKRISTDASLDIDAYKAMSKEELIDELIRSKANELRAKKGYEVRGAGVNKEFISLYNKNTK